jgi:hypothetical protein
MDRSNNETEISVLYIEGRSSCTEALEFYHNHEEDIRACPNCSSGKDRMSFINHGRKRAAACPANTDFCARSKSTKLSTTSTCERGRLYIHVPCSYCTQSSVLARNYTTVHERHEKRKLLYSYSVPNATLMHCALMFFPNCFLSIFPNPMFVSRF